VIVKSVHNAFDGSVWILGVYMIVGGSESMSSLKQNICRIKILFIIVIWDYFESFSSNKLFKNCLCLVGNPV